MSKGAQTPKIMELHEQGLTNAQIASRLKLTDKQVYQAIYLRTKHNKKAARKTSKKAADPASAVISGTTEVATTDMWELTIHFPAGDVKFKGSGPIVIGTEQIILKPW
jgi:hypothetical protein